MTWCPTAVARYGPRMTTEASDAVLCEIESGVATITLNRPERNNGWSGEIENGYFDHLEACNLDSEVRAIVVTGAGRSFCPGADMKMLAAAGAQQDKPAGSQSQDQLITPDRRPGYLPMLVNKPIIGAINGACAGVGLVQAMMFDLRFAAKGAKFTMAFSRRGLIAEYGSSWLLPRLVGQSRALDLLMSSRVILAEEALELGLVNRVFEPADLLDEAKAYAHDVAVNCCPASLAVMKQQVMADYNRTLPDAVAAADKLMVASLKRPDFKEGVSSFLERRPPSFSPYTGSIQR